MEYQDNDLTISLEHLKDEHARSGMVPVSFKFRFIGYSLPAKRKQMQLKRDFRKTILQISEQSYPKKSIKVDVQQVSNGSIEIVGLIWIAIKAVKEYKPIKEGIKEILDDLVKAKNRLLAKLESCRSKNAAPKRINTRATTPEDKQEGKPTKKVAIKRPPKQQNQSR